MTSCASPWTPPPPVRVTRGATKTFLLTVIDANNEPVDLTDGKAWFTVKNRLEDAAAIIRKRNAAAGGVDGQILITVPQTAPNIGQAQIFLVPADTLGLDPNEAYVCDAWVQLSGGQQYQVISNRQFIIEPAVTTNFLNTP